MRTLELENYGVMEMNSENKIDISGGYGYHAYHDAASKHASQLIAKACDRFVSGMKNQIDLIWDKCAC